MHQTSIKYFVIDYAEYFANQQCLIVPDVGPAVKFCWDRLTREAQASVGALFVSGLTESAYQKFRKSICK